MNLATYIPVAALFAVTIGVQVWYLRTYAAQITTATRVVMWSNIALLVAAVVGLGAWLLLARGN